MIDPSDPSYSSLHPKTLFPSAKEKRRNRCNTLLRLLCVLASLRETFFLLLAAMRVTA